MFENFGTTNRLKDDPSTTLLAALTTNIRLSRTLQRLFLRYNQRVLELCVRWYTSWEVLLRSPPYALDHKSVLPGYARQTCL
jgi:hypothetical protein